MAHNPKKAAGQMDAGIGGKVFTIPAVSPRKLIVRIEGNAPLLMNNGARKKDIFNDVPEGEVKKKRKLPTMRELYEQSMYGETKGRDGKTLYRFPAVAFKVAMVDACRFAEGLTMVMARGAIFVKGTDPHDSSYVLVEGTPEEFQHVGRTNSGGPCPNCRAKFNKWSTDIVLEFSDQIRDIDVLNLLNLAGFHCGVGDWRPMSKHSSSGQFGRFSAAAGSDSVLENNRRVPA